MLQNVFLVSLFMLFLGCQNSESKQSSQKKIENHAHWSQAQLPHKVVHAKAVGDYFTLFNDLNYTKKSWQSGIHLVPRVYLDDIPESWQKNAGKLEVKKKKELFFRLLAPLILRANEKIEAQRSALYDNKLSKAALLELARRYKVLSKEDQNLSKTQLEVLKKRVDTIPVSLALAQGAQESGWGTSRFAILGNSLFGQWDFSGKGMAPEQQRKELGNYGLARFDKPQDAVDAYMLNLNTHRAYKKLRDLRASLRKEGKAVTGLALAGTLDKYSERGEAYVKELRSLIRYNKLDAADDAILDKNEVITIVAH